jgi:hypothetical protein
MTTQEVFELLKIDNLDEVYDAFELAIFDIKKQLLSKPLLYKTAQSRCKQLEQLASIQNQFELEDFAEKDLQFEPEMKVDSNPLLLWNAYCNDRNAWKKLFLATQSPQSLIELINNGLKLELHYAQQFKCEAITDEKPLFGKDVDEMAVQRELAKVNDLGWNTFALLHENREAIDISLLLALKRLSLLSKFLQDGNGGV